MAILFGKTALLKSSIFSNLPLCAIKLPGELFQARLVNYLIPMFY